MNDITDYEQHPHTLQTIMGPKIIMAPRKFEDDMSVRVWRELVRLTRNLEHGGDVRGTGFSPYKRQKDRAADAAQQTILSRLIANHGMAPFYWIEAAKAFGTVKEQEGV
jgi:hypothetical protein